MTPQNLERGYLRKSFFQCEITPRVTVLMMDYIKLVWPCREIVRLAGGSISKGHPLVLPCRVMFFHFGDDMDRYFGSDWALEKEPPDDILLSPRTLCVNIVEGGLQFRHGVKRTPSERLARGIEATLQAMTGLT